MSAAETTLPAPEPVRLAEAADFSLGRARVRPSLGRVEFADGPAEQLEPRVMQVLVALARADGAILSRGALIDSCWEGRIVGEDAITRVLGKLRRLSERDGAGFRIETQPRIGVRLVRTEALDTALPAAAEVPARRMRRALAVGFAAALVVAAVAGVLAFRELRPREWRIDGYQALAAAPGWERQPDLSPDGRFVAYSAPPLETPGADNGDIYLRNLTGGDSIRLVAGPDHDSAPAFSPEGDQIAFLRTSSNHEAGQLPRDPCYVIVKPVPEGAERVVGRCPGFMGRGALDWTADGQGLLIPHVDRQWTSRIVRLDLATGSHRTLTSPPPGHRDHQGVDSPDGRRLAFLRYSANDAADVWIQDLRSGRLTRATEQNARILSLDWSPDGRSVLFSSDVEGATDLWAAPASGGGSPQRLLVGLRQVGRLSTANGLAAFETRTRSTRIARRALDGLAAEVAVFDGSVGGFDISSRGDLAAIAGADGWWLWLQRAGGPLRRLIKLDVIGPWDLIWSPDGGTLAFLADVDGRAYVHLLQPENGRLRRLPSPVEELQALSWTDGGRALAYAGRDASGWRIWKAELSSDAPARPITPPGLGWLAAAPNGTLYASVLKPGAAVWRLDPGKPPVQVAPDRESDGWLPRNDGLVFWSFDKPGMWLHRFAGGPPTLFSRYQWTMASWTVVDPRNGDVLFSETAREEHDLGLVRLTRR